MYADSPPEEDGEFGQTMRGVVGGTKLFGRFTLQKVLGRGGMGIVWLARDERLERMVALKLVPEAVCFDPSAHEDLKRETRKSLLLTHPNIVRIFDFIEDEQTAAISMEYVDGATLSSLRVKKPAKCFEISEISSWVASLCEALNYAHESASIIHRDLKPANLMVNSRGDLKVSDFGIACTLRESMSCISVRTSSGTLNYMSPQQMLGEDPAPSDDVYAVGATLYELLSSKPPFYGGDIASQVREVIAPTITQRRAKFNIVGEAIPKHWEETIAGCLAKDPAHRPRTASDIARRLRLTGPVLTHVTETPKWTERINPRYAAVAGGVVALVLAFTLGLSRRADPPPALIQAAAKAPAPPAYAIEKPVPLAVATPAADAAAPAPTAVPQPTAPPAIAEKAESKNARLQLSTTPGGARYAIYPGVIAGRTAPGAAPLRAGSSPDAVEDLPPGRYTLFFHHDNWGDDRAEISVHAGESVPVDYTFPHGSAVITSTPEGAEIFFGTDSLGVTPLTVDLPLGKQKLVARYPDLPERSQAVTISSETPAKVGFQMKTRSRSSSPRATPPPTAIDKIGQSFKNIFGPKKDAKKKKH